MLPLTFYYGIQLIKPFPKFHFFAVEAPARLLHDASQKEREEYQAQMKTYKDVQREAQEKFHKLLDEYNLFYFYASLLVGFIVLLLGSLVIPSRFLGLGCILGSIIILVTGYMRVWEHLSDIIKFISLFALLLFLFVLGMILWRKE